MPKLVALELSLPAGGKEVSTYVGIYAKASVILRDDVEELVEKVTSSLRKSPWPIHALIVVAPSIEEEALQKLESWCKDIGLPLVVVRVPRVMDRVRLAAIGKAIEEQAPKLGEEPFKIAIDVRKLSDVIDVDVAEAMLREILESLAIPDRLRDVVKEPVALTEPSLLGPVKRYEDLVDAMKWLLYTPWNKFRVSDAYDYVSSKLAKFHLYRRGRKGLLSLDIESIERLREVVTTLAKNGLVKYDPSDDYVDVTQLSPLEERLVKVLEKVFDGVAHADRLRKFFVEVATNSDRIWRAILSILELRGVVCVSGSEDSCPDAPGRGYVVLLKGDRASKCVEKWLGYVESFVSRTKELEPYGYIVAGKERGYRAFTLSELIDVLEDLSRRARELLSIDSSLAVRLAKLALELATYGESVVIPEVELARDRIESITARIKELGDELEEGVKGVKDLLESYVAANDVVIELSLLDKLKKAHEVAKEIATKRISPEEFASNIENLWKSCRGKNFPFYFNKLGPVYHFNYKLYQLHAELRDFVEINEQGELDLSPSIIESIKWIESAQNYIKSAVEKVVRVSVDKVAEALEKCETLRNLSKVVKGYEVAKIRIEPIKASTPQELFKIVKRVIDEWSERVEGESRLVSEIMALASEVSRLEREAMDRCKSVASRIESVAELLEKCPTIFDSASACHSELDNVKKLISEAMNVIKSLSEYEAEAYTLREVRDRVKEVHDVLQKVVSELREDKLENCSKLLKEVARKVEQLVSNVYTLGALLARLRIETSIPYRKACTEALEKLKRGEYGGVCESIASLSRIVEEMKKLALSRGALNHEELDVYTALDEIRGRAKGRLRLDEAIEILVERLNMPYEYVKKVVIGLIEKGVLDVYI